MDSDCVMVTTTTDSEEAARELAQRLIECRLAACVQYWPIRSVYRWQGQTENAAEYLLVAKTRAELAERLSSTIAELHSYELPEITVTPIVGGSEVYLGWITAETMND